MRRVLIFILSLLLFCLPAWAETEINVKGNGTVQISADYAVISLGVSFRENSVMKAQSETNLAIASIKSALYEVGIENTDISLDRINIYSSYDSSWTSSRKETMVYTASQHLQIKVNDLNGIGKIIDVAFGAGADSLDSVSYYSNDATQARDQAMRLAVQDATQKAEVLANALNLKITGIESVTQSPGYSQSALMTNSSFMLDEEDSYAPTLVQPNKISVSVEVSICFEAK